MKSGKKIGCGRIFRSLVFCILLAALLPVSAAENGKTENDRIAPLYREQIAQAIRDYRAWKNNDLCVCFPVITDLHTNLVTTDPRNCQQRAAVEHLVLLTFMVEEAGADFAADLGDNGFDVPLKTQEKGKELLARMEKVYRESRLPVIHCVGNHDLFFPWGMDKSFWGAWLRKINRGKADFTTGSCGSFGFYDIPGKPCRVFFLNTNDGAAGKRRNEAGFSAEQKAFLKQHLLGMPKKYTAIILTHISMRNQFMWKNSRPPRRSDRFPDLMVILNEFIANGGKLAGVFSGHGHYDNFDFENGINHFMFQGYGGISSKSELPPQGRAFQQPSEKLQRGDTFDLNEYCLLDLVAVKLEKREIRIFRAGAGGFNFHRGAKF